MTRSSSAQSPSSNSALLQPTSPQIHTIAREERVFPASTMSGHIELRVDTGDPKRSFAGCELHTLRHTGLTSRALQMDPWALACLAGHRDRNITKRYVQAQEQTILDAMKKARGVKSGHSLGTMLPMRPRLHRRIPL